LHRGNFASSGFTAAAKGHTRLAAQSLLSLPAVQQNTYTQISEHGGHIYSSPDSNGGGGRNAWGSTPRRAHSLSDLSSLNSTPRAKTAGGNDSYIDFNDSVDNGVTDKVGFSAAGIREVDFASLAYDELAEISLLLQSTKKARTHQALPNTVLSPLSMQSPSSVSFPSPPPPLPPPACEADWVPYPVEALAEMEALYMNQPAASATAATTVPLPPTRSSFKALSIRSRCVRGSVPEASANNALTSAADSDYIVVVSADTPETHRRGNRQPLGPKPAGNGNIMAGEKRASLPPPVMPRKPAPVAPKPTLNRNNAENMLVLSPGVPKHNSMRA
jgi:hypothetical protein